MQVQLYNYNKLFNWLDLNLVFVSSYGMICFPLWLLLVIQSSVKSKLLTTNHLSLQKVYLYHKIYSNPNEILRTVRLDQHH